MKTILVALLCGLTLQVLEATPIKCTKEPCEVDIYGPDFRCEPHKSFTHPDGCNTCFCTDNGKAGGCTRMLCPTPASKQFCKAGEIVEVAGLKCECKEISHGVSWTCEGHIKREIKTYSVDISDPEFRCKPNERIMLPDGVNFCWCDSEGKVSACAYSAVKTPKCQPGQSFKADCNTCFCGDNGIAVCTLMECIHEPIQIKPSSSVIQNRKELCTPGEIVQIGHLKCRCDEIPHGISWKCEGHIKREIQTYSANKCTPGTTFKIDCNRCFCGDNGMAACTLMECNPPSINMKPSSLIIKKPEDLCTLGEVVEIAGLKCECKEIPHGISWTCEGHFERHIETYSANKCTPGTTFKVDCNTCFCTETGMAACTEIGCPPIETYSSTEMRTLDPLAKDFSCTPYESFRHIDGCNTCACMADGKLAACTLKMCQPMIQVSAENSIMDPSDPNFHCTPGQNLHLGVADSCVCGKDGKHVMCTYSANSDDEFHCTPGEHFNFGPANSCICEADGKHAACTISAVDYIDTDHEDPVHKCSLGDKLRGKCNL